MRLDKVTPEALTTFLWVGAALVAFALATWTLVERIKKASEWRQNIDTKLGRDKSRIDSLEDGQKAICRGILALLSHEINGNSVDKLRSAQNDITDFLIEKKG